MAALTHILISLLLVVQSTPEASLRALLGGTLVDARQKLDEINTERLQKRKLTPAQIKSELARLKFPAPNLPANLVVLRADNAGSGLIAMLAQDIIGADQINLALCAATERIMAAQILITTDPVVKDELVDRLKNSFNLPEPVPFNGYRPAIEYPLPRITYTDDGHWMAEAEAQPVTVWRSNDIEAVFQVTSTSFASTGVFWITDPTVANACAAASQKK